MGRRLVLDTGAGALVIEAGERPGELLVWLGPDDGRRVALAPGLVLELCGWLEREQVLAQAREAFQGSFHGGAA